MRENEKASAGTEGRAHFTVGWGGSCSVSLRTLTGGTSRSRALLFLLWTHCTTYENNRPVMVVGPASWSAPVLAHSHTCPWCVGTGEFRHAHLLFSRKYGHWESGGLGVGDCTSDCFFFPMYNFPGTEEQAKREAAEKEKLLEQKLKELQQKFEDQERAFKVFRVQMTEEVRERDNFLRKMNERIEMLEVSLVWVWAVTVEQSPGTSGRDGWKLKQSCREKHHDSLLR